MAVPLSQLTTIEPDKQTREAIKDGHYWVAQVLSRQQTGPGARNRQLTTNLKIDPYVFCSTLLRPILGQRARLIPKK
jgi:Calcium binding